jgi:uncharacterized radical SAM protein YgiQ
MTNFLPTTLSEVKRRGWKELDIILITGDAYVDHPAFGGALLGRDLEALGYKVGIIPQPDWTSERDFLSLGRPRLFFGVSAGALDSMVAHYTPAKRSRRQDSYSPGGKIGYRPDRAVLVYCNRLRQLFKDIPIIIGGIEASLRRLAHYDYWENKVRRSILTDSGADLLIYGMGELPLRTVADRMNQGGTVWYEQPIPGTVFRCAKLPEWAKDGIILPSAEEVSKDKSSFVDAQRIIEEENDPIRGRILLQKQGGQWVVQTPPSRPLTSDEMDVIYSRPFTRRWHPRYDQEGIPALKEVLFSLTTHRGCLGECSFCTLALHQGRFIQRRSIDSIINEAERLVDDTRWRGVIHDVGGPSANLYLPTCSRALARGACKGRSCLTPEVCRHLPVDSKDELKLLRRLREMPGVHHVFVRSGIRFDLALADKERCFLREICMHHVSGQLKVAPEHVSDSVLKLMNKPGHEKYLEFYREFNAISEEAGKKQYLIPYLIAGHPGTRLKDAVALAEYIRDQGRFFEQVQEFTPLPMTASACMHYAGVDPRTGMQVYVPSDQERAMQRALLQYQDKKNWALVRKALKIAGREDLIGRGAKALAPPEKADAKKRN